MPELLTIARVKTALRDQIAGTVLSDSQIPGLQIRVTGVGVRWSFRCRVQGNQVRYDLGPVCDGSKDLAPALCLDGARTRAFTLREQARRGNNPARQIEAWATGKSVRDIPEPTAPAPAAASWLWEDAVKRFVDWNVTYRRQDTADDYAQKLGQVPEMHRFNGRMVSAITRNELMQAVAAIAERGIYSTAAGVRRTLSRFFNWLSESERQNQTNVAVHVMLGTKDPEPPRSEDGENEADFDPDDEVGDVPSEISLGRALVIARSGVLPERTGLGIQLLFGTVQRRRAVIGATRWRFRDYAETPGEQAWYVPPFFRKSGSKRGSKSHLVPIVSWVDGVARRLDRMCVGDNPFLLPALRPRDKDRDQHCDIEMLNRALENMPDVEISPHGARYAFASYGERDLGFAKSEGKVVLDHLEGTDPKDVTGNFYSSDPAVKRKREMLQAWCAWLDGWAAKAAAADPKLADLDWLRQEIFRRRYGEERLAKRIEYRARRGWPMWGLGGEDLQEAAE